MSDTTAALPTHLGLILDGNRRWAKNQGKPTLDGHKKGAETLQEIAPEVFKRGIKYLSAYIFSTENWKRSKEEVAYLMDLVLWYAKTQVKELGKQNIKVKFLGEDEHLSAKVIKAMRDAEANTKENTGGTVLLCLNYGGQQEITSAVNSIIASGVKGEVTPKMIEDNLYQPDVPPIDLIIRTSGEHRISNFMLWRAAYSELYFTDKHWPDFNTTELDKALAEYASRQRRFGK